MEKSLDRLEILKKIEEYELDGKFDVDVENDPPTEPLRPEEVDYLRKKLSSKIKRFFSYKMAVAYVKKSIKNGTLIIKDIIGKENLDLVKGGAIVTCNHFNAHDNFAIWEAFRHKFTRKRRMYKVIREGNYRFSGLFGTLMRNCDTLPLSSNIKTMSNFLGAVDTLLQNGNYILIYPEQAMWWNYRKIRPFKVRAFKFASKNIVPVIPCFITMSDSEKIGVDGFPIQEYTVHILPPIFPDENKTAKENAEIMCEANYKACVETYERVYGEKMTYNTKENI